MVRSTEYLRSLSSSTVADLDDRVSLRYKRQLEYDLNGINPYGAFLYTLPVVFRKLLLLKQIKTAVVRNEIELLNQYELEMGRTCSSTVFVARKEAEEFNRELGVAKAIAVPVGVDTDFFFYRECGNNADHFIGFLGALSVAHNENAVRHFIRDIMPLVLKDIPDAVFLVIGGGASKELLDLSSDHVVFTGRVDDVRDYLEKCKVFVCPMTFGSGIKTKILESMSMGLPVVTTSIGAENIDACNEKEWIVEDNDLLFSKRVKELLENREKRTEIGKQASNFILDNWTWSKAKDALKSLIG